MFNPEHIIYDFFMDSVEFFPDSSELCPIVDKKWRRCAIDVEVSGDNITIIRKPTCGSFFEHRQEFIGELPKAKERALKYLLAIVKSSIISPENLSRTTPMEIEHAQQILVREGKKAELMATIREALIIKSKPIVLSPGTKEGERYKPYKPMQYTGD